MTPLLGLHSLSRPLLRRPSVPILVRTYTAKPPRPGPANTRLPATTQIPPNPRPPPLGPKVPKGNPQKKSVRLPNPIGGAPSPKKDFSIPATLGAKSGPTLLYAHHPNLFLVGCYGLAGLSVGWCVYTYNLDRSSIGLPEWVGKVHYFGIAMMGLLAGGCVFYPTRIIQKIYAVPNKRKGISIVLHRRPYIPFLPCKKITVDSPEGLLLEREFQPVGEVKGGEAEVREVGWVEGITSAPRRGLELVKKMVSSKDFVGLKVRDGGGYLLHEKGWCWERRGLDRLFGGGGQRYQ